MAHDTKLTAERRGDMGSRAARKLRSKGRIPAVLYGHGEEVVPLSLDETEVRTMLRHGHAHGLLTVQMDGKNESVVIKDLQYDPFGSEIFHLDFARVSADERVQITVPVVLKGRSPGAAGGGVLEHQLHEIEMECSAANLVDQIVVNVNDLQLNGVITVGDLALPEGAKALHDADAVVVHVVEATEVPEEEAEAGAAEPELIRREKEEAEETEE